MWSRRILLVFCVSALGCVFDSKGLPSSETTGEIDCGESVVGDCWPGTYGEVLWSGDRSEADFVGLKWTWDFRSSLGEGYLHPRGDSALGHGLDPDSDCHADFPSLKGPTQRDDLSDVSQLSFAPLPEVMVIGARNGQCPSGLLVAQRGEQYLVMDILRMNFVDEFGGSSYVVHWWLGDPGVTDFSNAPEP